MQNEVRELKFNNITPKCQSPLVETDNSQAFVDGVDGCGLPCNSPLFSHEEHEQVQRFTQTLAAMCLTTNLFAVVSKLTDSRFYFQNFLLYCNPYRIIIIQSNGT